MKVLMVKMAGGIGGAEVYSQNLVEGLKKYYPEDKIFFLTNLPGLRRRIKKAGGEVFTLPVFHEEVGTKRGLIRLFLALPKYLYFFTRKIFYLRFKKDLKLVLFQGTTEKIVLTPLLKLLKMKVIWLEHGPIFSSQRAKEVLFLYRLNSQRADKIIAESKDAQEDLINGGVEKNKVSYLPTGVDTEFFKPREQRKKGLPIVGYLGAVCQEKGIEEFLKVAKLLVKSIKSLKFKIIGEGTELSWAKNWVKNNKLEKQVEFIGFVNDIRPYLARFSVFFFPTKHLEGLSLSLMDAMAMGIPVVARDIGGNRELVLHGRTGYLFKDETPEELANLLIGLLQDQKKREKMGRKARSIIEQKFNGLIWIKKWQEIFSAYQ